MTLMKDRLRASEHESSRLFRQKTKEGLSCSFLISSAIMNKNKIEYTIGDLVKIKTGDLGVVYNSKVELGKLVSYQVHFCGDDEPDPRWVWADQLIKEEK